MVHHHTDDITKYGRVRLAATQLVSWLHINHYKFLVKLTFHYRVKNMSGMTPLQREPSFKGIPLALKC
jgi:hypothetical protein